MLCPTDVAMSLTFIGLRDMRHLLISAVFLGLSAYLTHSLPMYSEVVILNHFGHRVSNIEQ